LKVKLRLNTTSELEWDYEWLICDRDSKPNGLTFWIKKWSQAIINASRFELYMS